MEKLKALNGMLDWIVNDCNEDVCRICANLRDYSEEELNSIPEDEELCVYKRENGKQACKEGIVKYFKKLN